MPDQEEHWKDRFFLAGIVWSSVAGILLGFLLGLFAPDDMWTRTRRALRILLHREHPNWEMLTQ